MTLDQKKVLSVTPLLFTTLMISICSIVYELIIGSLSSYLLGDSITQFSLTIGIYLFAMGMGSYLSKYVEKNLFDYFASIEILVGVIGGFSSTLLFVFYVKTQLYVLVMYLLTIIIGLLVGLEIPFLVRIMEANGQSLKSGVANLFAFDYLGGLVGSILFPLMLLPKLGYITVAFLTGLMNLAAAAVIVFRYRAELRWFRLFRGVVIVCGLMLVTLLFAGNSLTDRLEQGLYRDQVILSQQTPYQKIVVTQHKDDLRLFLNGNVQFSSMDEYRYHEALIHVSMGFRPDSTNILLLGAGDGLAARELLKYPQIEQITIVDLDQEMVELCQTNPQIKKINAGALENEKVKLVYEDAFIYMQNFTGVFDMIVVDLPDPDNESLSKLYSSSFYQIASNAMEGDGIIVTQSSSPYYTGDAFWCITKTMGSVFNNVVPYHLYVPSFGDWGFNLASKAMLNPAKLELDENIPFRYLNEENTQSMFMFGEDEKKPLDTIQVNTVLRPVLVDYYQKETSRW